MKNLKLTLVIVITALCMACHRGPHVVIASQSNNNYTKLEYAGWVVLNNTRTQIQSINYGGYINFNRNNDELYISTGRDGKLFYELNGDRQAALSNTGRNLLAEAVRMIARSQKR